MRSHLLSCWSKLSKNFQNITGYCYCLCPSEIESEVSIAEGTLHFRWRVQWPLSQNWPELPPPWGGTMQLPQERSYQQSCRVMTHMNHISDQHGTVTLIKGYQQLSLIVLRPIQQSNQAWFLKPSQLPRVTEVMDLRGKLTKTNLLNQYNPQLHSKYLSLFLQVSVVLTTSSRNALFATDKDHYRKPCMDQKVEL